MVAKRLAAFAALARLALVPPVAMAADAPFYVGLFARIMVFAIAAVSLALLLGYGGLVSFGHAAYLGIGAYAVGILSYHGITGGFVHFATAFFAAAIAALAIGFVSLRTSGVYFIMITLAFGQMVYFVGIGLDEYGGDDGLNIARHSDFGAALNLDRPVVFYYFAYGLLLLFLFLGNRIVQSRFGMLLQGVKSNERRMVALGFATFRYKLTAFVMAGGVSGCRRWPVAPLALSFSPSLLSFAPL